MSLEVPVSELIQRCRAGESSAREALFQRYQHYLQILARAQLGKHLRSKCDASDVVQMTMLEAHRDFNAFQGNHEQELLAWLRRILAHNLFNETRRYNAQQRETTREVSIDQVRAGVEQSSVILARGLADDTPTPSQVAAKREDAIRLADALSHLPEDYQTVLILRFLEELPSEEVAQRMGRSPGAVRMLQLRALVALREQICQEPTE